MIDIQILGTGAWGTALAVTLAQGGYPVTLTPRNPRQVEVLEEARENRQYLPDIALPDNVRVSSELNPDTGSERLFILAAPSYGLREWASRLRDSLAFEAENPPAILSLAKGLESKSLKLPHEVLEEVLPGFACYALSGPNFAREVACGLPTAAVLAGTCHSPQLERLQQVISSRHFRVYTTDDIAGVELGGCLKNVYAIGSGICHGLGLGDNARAALMTRSLSEMVQLIPPLEGRVETVYGLSGIGDLVATCYGESSRNRDFGWKIGEGASIESILNDSSATVEGYYACANFHQLFKAHDIQGPILEQLYAVLYRGTQPREALAALMSRNLKPEKQT